MHFLNDKFFRVSVLAFLLFMALPFIFSTPEPPKPENKKYSDYFILDTLYSAANKVAKFYGFKKEEDNENVSSKQINKSKIQTAIEQKKQNNTTNSSSEKQEEIPLSSPSENSQDSLKKTDTIEQEQNAPSLYSYYKTEAKESAVFQGKNYPVLTSKNGKKYISTEKGPVYLTPPAKTYNKPYYYSENQNYESDYSYKKTEESLGEKKYLKERPYLQEKETQNTIIVGKNTKYYPSYFGNKAFSSSNEKAKDLYSNFNAGVKEIQDFKLSQQNNGQKKPEKEVYIKTYRTEIINPINGKREISETQRTISEEDRLTAAKIKKITLDKIKEGVNEQTYKQGEQEFALPNAQVLQENKSVPPHYHVPDILEPSALDTSYETAQDIAKKNLPDNDFPFLEFILGKEKDEVQRASNHNFNVVAISNILANRVRLPMNPNIDFLNSKERIFVVPDEDLYKQYKDLNIPVIYYPGLSPINLRDVYKSVPSAIETLKKNKQAQSKEEISQNKSEIEQILKK